MSSDFINSFMYVSIYISLLKKDSDYDNKNISLKNIKFENLVLCLLAVHPLAYITDHLSVFSNRLVGLSTSLNFEMIATDMVTEAPLDFKKHWLVGSYAVVE